MAEASLQQCPSALCNAGDSVELRSLVDHFRLLKVSMVFRRELQRKRITYACWRACTEQDALAPLAEGLM